MQTKLRNWSKLIIHYLCCDNEPEPDWYRWND